MADKTPLLRADATDDDLQAEPAVVPAVPKLVKKLVARDGVAHGVVEVPEDEAQ